MTQKFLFGKKIGCIKKINFEAVNVLEKAHLKENLL